MSGVFCEHQIAIPRMLGKQKEPLDVIFESSCLTSNDLTRKERPVKYEVNCLKKGLAYAI